MMGSVGELPQAPAQKTVFVEDMTEAQLASAVSASRSILISLNTCINSPYRLLYISFKFFLRIWQYIIFNYFDNSYYMSAKQCIDMVWKY